GHELWQRRFQGDPSIIGGQVRLGRELHTVVGVMPPGFAFPVSHQAWTPLRLDAAAALPRTGPALVVFGRLAPGVSRAAAQRELARLGEQLAAASPTTHQHLSPEVLPYAQAITGIRALESMLLRTINLFLVALLVLVAANVALLTFARAATRESEITVRS